MQNEKRVEQRLVKRVKEQGGLCLKWVAPGTTGVPDRLIFLKGQVHLVELKDPKGVLSARQVFMIQQLSKLGIAVSVLSSVEEVDAFMETL